MSDRGAWFVRMESLPESSSGKLLNCCLYGCSGCLIICNYSSGADALCLRHWLIWRVHVDCYSRDLRWGRVLLWIYMHRTSWLQFLVSSLMLARTGLSLVYVTRLSALDAGGLMVAFPLLMIGQDRWLSAIRHRIAGFC